MAKVYSSLKYLSKGSMAISKKEIEEKGREKKKKKKVCVSPCQKKEMKKMMMKREVAMPPTRKEDAMKGVNSIYTAHMLSLCLGL